MDFYDTTAWQPETILLYLFAFIFFSLNWFTCFMLSACFVFACLEPLWKCTNIAMKYLNVFRLIEVFFFCECFSLSAAGQCRKSIMQTENRKLFFDDSFSSCLYCSLLPPNHPHKFSNFLRVEMQQQKLYLLTMRKKSSSFRDESKKYNYATKISLRKITKQNFLCFQTKKLWKLRK